jgi:type IV pilus assembly protein PilY1
MPRIHWKRLAKTGPAFIIGLCCASIGVASPLVIPDTPLFLRSLGVDPNLIMTIDDSASMMSAFLPDNWRVYPALGCSPSCVNVTYGGNTFGIRHAATNRYKSAAFNAMYYNPFVAYGIPTRPDSVTYSTSFDKAKKNGFLASSVTLDLNSEYRAQID